MNDDNCIIMGLNDAESIQDMKRRHLALGLRMQSVATAAFRELERKVAAGEPLNLSAEDARVLFDLGLRLERGTTAVPNSPAPSSTRHSIVRRFS